MRLSMILLFGPALVVSIFHGLSDGNPIAWGFAGGFAAPIAFAFTLAAMPVKLPSRKADPAKIARMEADLGIGDAGERAEQSRERHGCIDPDCPHEHYTVGGLGTRVCVPGDGATFKAKMAEWGGRANIVDTEAPTAIVQPYAGPPHTKGWPQEHERHCPRPEGCVISHPCRKCGADKGQACVGEDDLMEMTF